MRAARIRCLSAVCALTVLAVGRPISASAEHPQVNRQVEMDFVRADAYVQAQMRRTKTPGLGYAVISGDKVVHQRTWGRDGDGAPITARTPFLLGSLTKSFTALAVMQLAEAGQIELDGPVTRYLGWWPSDRVTVRHLLNHTSGLSARDGYVRADRFDNRPGGVQRLARELAQVRTGGAPGVRHEYSDANYMLLGALVEQVSGRPFGEQLRNAVLRPLQMRDSVVGASDAERLRLAPGHRFFFGRPQRFDPPYDTSGVPYGYVGASLSDLSGYAIAQLNGGRHDRVSVLSDAGVRQMHTGAARVGDAHTYGFGWRDDAFEDLRTRMVWHGGALPGYHSILILVPDRKLAVIVLQNAFSVYKDVLFNAAGLGVMRIVLGAQPRPVNADPMFTWMLAGLVAITALLAVGVGWSLFHLIHPRRQRPRTLPGALAGGGAAVAACLTLAAMAGYWLPRSLNADLRVLLLFSPDGGRLLVAVLSLSLALAALQALRTAIAAWLMHAKDKDRTSGSCGT